MRETPRTTVRSGIAPLDETAGGLHAGGIFVVIGVPGPAKMVAALQFLHEGVSNGEHALLITNAEAESILDVAAAWGFSMRTAWEEGRLQILGFRPDFELRAIRSIEPSEVIEELDSLVSGEPARIAVDPGVMFLKGGARTRLSAAFVEWARQRRATLLATFSVDGDPNQLPSAADWLVASVTGRLTLTRASDTLYHLALLETLPSGLGDGRSVSVELRPGAGLVSPREAPRRRGEDRVGVDRNRLLLVSLGDEHELDFEAWANRTFDCDVVSAPFDAVARVQEDPSYGCILLHASRQEVRNAVQACRALRPLTRAAIVFASDQTIRSTDRVAVLEAGADDCLSGGLDFRELTLRIRQAIASGAKPAPRVSDAARPGFDAPPEGSRGVVTRDMLAREVERRAESPATTFFCMLQVRAPGLSDESVERELADLVRSDEGDLVAGGDECCLILLQGARKGQLDPLLSRLRSRLGALGPRGTVEVEVHSHPAEADRIESLLRASVGHAK